MRRLGEQIGFLLALTIWVLPQLASAQTNLPVFQSMTSPVTPGHVPVWITDGVVGDSGPATNGAMTELGITNTGTPFCINDQPISGLSGYHELCLGANSLGGGLVSYQNYAGAAALPLQLNINGTFYPIPGSISGLPTVAGNAQLQAEPSSFGALVVREAFQSGYSGPVVFYQPSLNPCTLNSGAGDGGSQVLTSDGRCWLAILDPGRLDIRIWGAIGSADSTAAINAAQAYARTLGGSGKVYIPSAGSPYKMAGTNPGLGTNGACLNVQDGDVIYGDRLSGVGSGGTPLVGSASEILCTAQVDGISMPSNSRVNNVQISNLVIAQTSWTAGTTDGRSSCIHRSLATGWLLTNVVCKDFPVGINNDFTATGGGGEDTIQNLVITDQDGYPVPNTGYPSFGIWSHIGASLFQMQDENVSAGAMYLGQQLSQAYTGFTGSPTTTFTVDLSNRWGANSHWPLFSAKGLTVLLNGVPQTLQQNYILHDVTPGAPSATIWGSTVTSTYTAGSNTVSIASANGLPTSVSCSGSGVYPCSPAIGVTGYGIPPGTYVAAISGTTVTLGNAEGLSPWISRIGNLTFAELFIAAQPGCNFVNADNQTAPVRSNCGQIINVIMQSAVDPTQMRITWDDPWGIAGIWLNNGATDNAFYGMEIGSVDTAFISAPGTGGRNLVRPDYIQIMVRCADDWAAGDDIYCPNSSSSTFGAFMDGMNKYGWLGDNNTSSILRVNNTSSGSVNPLGNALPESTALPRNVLLCGDLSACPWTSWPVNNSTTRPNIGTTPTYTADGWAVWGGASSNVFVQDADGGEVSAQRQVGSSDTTQICIAQIVSPDDMASLKTGNVANPAAGVLSAVLNVGANFSAAKGIEVKVISGTAIGEGMAALQGGTWTGQATVLDVFEPGSGKRQTWPAGLASTALEAAVEFCATPTGAAGADDSFAVGQIQYEGAYGPTAFLHMSPSYEALRAGRWYRQSYLNHTIPGTASSNAAAATLYLQTTGTTTFGADVQFGAPQMFCTPAITLYSPLSGSAGNAELSTGADVPTSSLNVSGRSFHWATTGTLAGTAGQTLTEQWSASCRL